MPPVPIYTNSPISKAKANDATGSQDDAAPGPEAVAAAAAPVPGRYVPVQPTPTTAVPVGVPVDGPPPPQPGAAPVPVPPGTGLPLPPPPKAGEVFRSPPTVQRMPPQLSMAAPPAPLSHVQRGTTTAAAAASVGPGPVSLEHPPGYQQNPNASDVLGYQQRASLDAAQERVGRMSPTGLVGGLGGANGGGGGGGGGDEGMWNSAVKWAQAAGEKLSAAENEVWRRINKD